MVGNYVGKEALAAVGSVGPIINSLIGFFIGLSAGAGVVISQSYGAGNREKLGRAVHTTFCMTLICCVIFYDPWCRYDAVYAAPDEHAVRCFR